jgi:hypothetical protein
VSSEIETYWIVLWQYSNLSLVLWYQQARLGWLTMDRYDHVNVNVGVNKGSFYVFVESARCSAVSDCGSNGSNHNGPDWITKRVSRPYSLQSTKCGSLGFVGPHWLEFT